MCCAPAAITLSGSTTAQLRLHRARHSLTLPREAPGLGLVWHSHTWPRVDGDARPGMTAEAKERSGSAGNSGRKATPYSVHTQLSPRITEQEPVTEHHETQCSQLLSRRLATGLGGCWAHQKEWYPGALQGFSSLTWPQHPSISDQSRFCPEQCPALSSHHGLKAATHSLRPQCPHRMYTWPTARDSATHSTRAFLLNPQTQTPPEKPTWTTLQGIW